MYSCRKTIETILETVTVIFVMFYCAIDSDSLTDLGYLKYKKMTSPSRTIKLESSPPTSRVKYINGKYPGSKRLGLEARRCLFSASYDECQDPAPDELIKVR